jgi:hypothetical protein
LIRPGLLGFQSLPCRFRKIAPFDGDAIVRINGEEGASDAGKLFRQVAFPVRVERLCIFKKDPRRIGIDPKPDFLALVRPGIAGDPLLPQGVIIDSSATDVLAFLPGQFDPPRPPSSS